MGVEEFYLNYREINTEMDLQFTQMVDDAEEQLKGSYLIDDTENQKWKSDPLYILARKLVEAGQVEMKDLKIRNITPVFDNQLFNLRRDYALSGIMFGSILMALLKSSDTALVDMGAIVADANLNSQYRLPEPVEPLIVLSVQSGNELEVGMQEDPTLSIFFTEPDRLPAGVRDYLTNPLAEGTIADIIRQRHLVKFQTIATRILQNTPTAHVS